MGILGIGTDLCELKRIEKAIARWGDKFAEKILSSDELKVYAQHSSPHDFLAKCFAAKEAVGKALGTGIAKGVAWQDIITDRDALGRPLVRLDGGADRRLSLLGGTSVHLSLTDEAGLVMAFAVLE